jgi:membrane-associated phospholipid phosphatase
MTGRLKQNPRAIRLLNHMNKILTGIVFCMYPLFLLVLLLEKDDFLVRAILVPGVSFGIVTVFRGIVNVPRPYERFGVPPVLKKDTAGKSFPSRHVFSVFIIAVTVFVQHPGAGIMLGVIGLFLAAIRVFGGVHTISDVLAGMLAGIFSGVIGYYLL